MRYSVRYRVADRSWLMIDTANGDEVVGVHTCKADAYRHAFSAQESWRKHDPEAEHLARVREMMPRTLVVGGLIRD